jgi:hypothetical protein
VPSAPLHGHRRDALRDIISIGHPHFSLSLSLSLNLSLSQSLSLARALSSPSLTPISLSLSLSSQVRDPFYDQDEDLRSEVHVPPSQHGVQCEKATN